MKFIVKRASIWGENESPCEEARLDSIVKVDTRWFNSPEEYDKKFGYGEWFSIGSNHMNKEGKITRDLGIINVWTVEINTLDELLNFYKKYGDIVMRTCMSNESYIEILIYDDYIE